MGKLADAIKEYKISPINSPRERESKEIIEQITGGQWWKDNVGKEFKWPKKQVADGKNWHCFSYFCVGRTLNMGNRIECRNCDKPKWEKNDWFIKQSLLTKT